MKSLPLFLVLVRSRGKHPRKKGPPARAQQITAFRSMDHARDRVIPRGVPSLPESFLVPLVAAQKHSMYSRLTVQFQSASKSMLLFGTRVMVAAENIHKETRSVARSAGRGEMRLDRCVARATASFRRRSSLPKGSLAPPAAVVEVLCGSPTRFVSEISPCHRHPSLSPLATPRARRF